MSNSKVPVEVRMKILIGQILTAGVGFAVGYYVAWAEAARHVLDSLP